MPPLERRLIFNSGGTGRKLRALYNGQNNDSTQPYKVGEATSLDGGKTWTRNGSNPLISASGSNWVSTHVKDPWLLPDGLTCYVSGYNGTRYQIGRLTRATLSSAWAYDSTSAPTIALGGSGAPDEHGCAFPTVWDESVAGAKRYKCWYRGEDASGVQTICYAYSADGISWTKVGRVLNVGGVGAWDHVGVLPGAILKVPASGVYYLYYSGQKNSSAPVHWQGGLATFTDPEGTYTKSGSNPILACYALSIGSSISQVLTSDAASGQAVVHVGDTSHWVVGMPMAVVASDVVTEYHTILSIDSGTQVTLASNLSSSFTTLHGATIRPFSFNSVTPRSVLVTPGEERHMFFSAFQVVDDLTVTGETVWEASQRATATALDGAWSIDESLGLLFPLSPGNSGWDKFSAENPAVIWEPY